MLFSKSSAIANLCYSINLYLRKKNIKLHVAPSKRVCHKKEKRIKKKNYSSRLIEAHSRNGHLCFKPKKNISSRLVEAHGRNGHSCFKRKRLPRTVSRRMAGTGTHALNVKEFSTRVDAHGRNGPSCVNS